MIEGVEIKRLIKHTDERGYLMELLRCDDAIFRKFGQAYVALNYPGIVRAWHYHKKQDDYLAVVKGMVKVAVYDARDGSPTQGQVDEFFMGEQSDILLKIPVGVMHGYKTLGTEPSLLVNFPSEPYDSEHPDEYRLPWDSDQIPYDWGIKMG